MNNNETPMWDDPAESASVRELLQTGRRAQVDYDASLGLARHVALVAAGASLPYWAKGAAAASASKIVAWVAVPVVAATVAATVWFSQQTKPEPVATHSSTVEQAPQLAAAPAVASVVVEATPSLAVAQPAASSERMASGARHKPARASSKPAYAEAAYGAKVLDKRSGTGLGTSAGRPSSSVAVALPSVGEATPQEVSAPSLTASSARVMTRAAEPIQPVAAVDEERATQPAPAAQGVAKTVGRAQLDDGRLEREMQMLAVAQRVLREDPARALRLAHQGEHEFAGSMFSAERQQVAVLALVRLGRLDEARRIGKAFLSKYPNAPWSQRLRHALATGRID